MPTCCICSATAGFVKAHIIPEAFFRELREGETAPLLVAGAKGEMPKKSRIGVYDPELLCSKCESKFLPWDTYAIEKLLTRFDDHFKPLVNDGMNVAYEAVNVDKLKILDFLVSVLWRASVSTHPFYNKVILGPHEQTVLSQMLVNYASAPQAFNAVLSRWMDDDDETLPTTAMMNPHREKWDDVNAYRLYLGKIVAYIKVDQRPFTEPFASLSLRASGPCQIVSRRLAMSKDLNVMRKTVFVAERNRREFRNRCGVA